MIYYTTNNDIKTERNTMADFSMLNENIIIFDYNIPINF